MCILHYFLVFYSILLTVTQPRGHYTTRKSLPAHVLGCATCIGGREGPAQRSKDRGSRVGDTRQSHTATWNISRPLALPPALLPRSPAPTPISPSTLPPPVATRPCGISGTANPFPRPSSPRSSAPRPSSPPLFLPTSLPGPVVLVVPLIQNCCFCRKAGNAGRLLTRAHC